MTDRATTNRRPLKSRSTRFATAAARAAMAVGLSANAVSFLGILIAALGAWAAVRGGEDPRFFLLFAVCVQLRLLANMLDGMVAVEGGRGSSSGPLWNEFPDRIEDSLLLVAFGYAFGPQWLGWATALLAAICAYVRLLGGSLGQPQDFGGPMAKPHRMAALTVGALVAIFWPAAIIVTLSLIALGTGLTIALRLRRSARALRG